MKNNFIRLCILLSLCLLANNAFAIRATSEMLTRTQSDGSVLNYFLRGDEHFNYLETVDGQEITETETGDLVYTASGQLAHNPENRSTQEISFLANRSQRAVTEMRRAKRAATPRRSLQVQRASGVLAGEISVPVLMIEFKDLKFNIANPQKVYSDKLNKEGYSGDGHNGSARDYFLDNSFGQFTVNFDVTAPVQISQNYAYYGANKNGNDSRPGTMIAEALKLASAGGFDFSKYDKEGPQGRPDGYIDFLVVIYAGLNEADGAGANYIWPHAYNVKYALAGESPADTNPVVNGVRGAAYACTSELMGASGTKQSGIGTACHEICHLIGLHDMYDTDYSESGGTNPGFGSWSIMDSGNKLNNERTPPYMTAFEREYLGWGTVTELQEEGTYSLGHIKTNGEIYRINTPKNYEYFLLENRQQTGWDRHLPGHGMLITRVYADKQSFFDNNEINSTKGQERVNLLEANGAYYYGGRYSSQASDAFPGTAHIAKFDDETREPVKFNNLPGKFETPANSLLWNDSELNKPVYNIEEQSGIIYFDFLEMQECNERPLISSFSPADRTYTQIINAGDVTLSVKGSAIKSYAWYKSTDPENILSTAADYSFKATSADQSGTYYVAVSNECASITSDFTVEVRQSFNLSRVGNVLTIDSGIDLKDIYVYNSQGQPLQHKAGQKGDNVLILSEKNLYLIKLDGKTVKVLM